MSGASSRVKVLSFPPVDDLTLAATLRCCVRAEGHIVLCTNIAGDTSAVKLPDFKPVFGASDCFKIVNVVGSKFGDLAQVLRAVENGTSVDGTFFGSFSLLSSCSDNFVVVVAALDSVVTAYTARLKNFIKSPPDSDKYTNPQIVITSFLAFDKLANKNDSPINEISLLPPELRALIPTIPRVSSLNRAVLGNLLTQPDVSNPDLFQFSSRALGHAWLRVQPDLHEAVKDALNTLDPTGNLVAPTLKAILKQ